MFPDTNTKSRSFFCHFLYINCSTRLLIGIIVAFFGSIATGATRTLPSREKSDGQHAGRFTIWTHSVHEAMTQRGLLNRDGSVNKLAFIDHHESKKRSKLWSETGIASWYGNSFHLRRAANGSIFDQTKLTAAHQTLPFGTRLKVHSFDTGQDVIVIVTDRGPFVDRRIIDLSRAAAAKLGMLHKGLAKVAISTIPPRMHDNNSSEVAAIP